jgi:hypothetical protein
LLEVEIDMNGPPLKLSAVGIIFTAMLLAARPVPVLAQATSIQVATGAPAVAAITPDEPLLDERAEALSPMPVTRRPTGLITSPDDRMRALAAAIIALGGSGAGSFPLLPK